MAGDESVPLGAFGTCCDELREAMSGEEFEPLITVADNGVLYMSVGLVDMEDEDPGMVDHPIFFCPFCGKGLQTADDVASKSAGDENDEA